MQARQLHVQADHFPEFGASLCAKFLSLDSCFAGALLCQVPSSLENGKRTLAGLEHCKIAGQLVCLPLLLLEVGLLVQKQF